MALPHGAVNWSAVCDCGISLSNLSVFILHPNNGDMFFLHFSKKALCSGYSLDIRCMLGLFVFCRLLIVFKNNLFENSFRNTT